MFLIREKSHHTKDPVYQKLPTNTMFIPEARVAKDYFSTGFYERNELNFVVKNLCNPEKNTIDIGAHIGFYCIDSAKNCKHVYAFECSPKSFNYLCANIALNNLDYKVQPTKHNSGFSDSESEHMKYYIRDPLDGGGNGIHHLEYDDVHSVKTIDVPTRKLDSYNLDNIGLVKKMILQRTRIECYKRSSRYNKKK